MCVHDTSSSDNRYVNDLVIVNAENVNMPTSLEDDAYILSSDTTIAASINKCSGSIRPVGRDGVADGSAHRASSRFWLSGRG
jgi:hypothetical protein